MNKKINRTLILGIAATCGLASCSTSNKVNQKDQTVIMDDNMDSGYLILSDSQREVVKSGNDFALRLFKSEQGMDSKVMSPLSVSCVMSMLANGADKSTLDAIMATIGMKGKSVAELNDTYKGIIQMSGSKDKSTVVKIANSIVANENVSLEKKFVDTMKDVYDANVSSMDFAKHSTVDAINAWCKKQTEGMIPNIISELDPSAVSVLLNAIYFNGTWMNKFDKADTKLERFQGYTRDIKRVQMMHQEDKFMYAKKEGYAAVKLPYIGDKYEMTVLLPDNGSSTGDMMKDMDGKRLESLMNDMEEYKVDLKLPRFTVETSQSLKDVLSQLGAKTMFTASADFSHMASSGFFVSEILHKAKIEVTEEGTKAAAVTAAIMTMSAIRPSDELRATFHADRPFVYIISERSTGAVFFIGQYTGDDC